MLVIIYGTLHFVGVPATHAICGEYLNDDAYVPSLREARFASSCGRCSEYLATLADLPL